MLLNYNNPTNKKRKPFLFVGFLHTKYLTPQPSKVPNSKFYGIELITRKLAIIQAFRTIIQSLRTIIQALLKIIQSFLKIIQAFII